MKRILIIPILFLTTAFAGSPKIDSTRLFIKLKSGANMPESQLILKSKHLFKENYILTTTDAQSLALELAANRDIISTENNYYADAKQLPKEMHTKANDPVMNFNAFNDPKAGRVWSFASAAKNGVSVDKSYLSPLGLEKEEIIVAVVDTGVDYNHEDLKAVMWHNPGEIAGNNIDDDNNGYIDDVYGINTMDKDANGNSTGDPMASHSHGTHVSGTIAAAQNNNVGIAGIASNVKIMAIRAVPDNADETDADVVESYLYAAKHGAKLINCSFGKRLNEGGMIVNETIDHIGQDYGVLVFAAAGNDYGRNIDSDLVYPASFQSDYLLVVASTKKSGGLSWFSNVGVKNVDLAAPGSDIYSSVPGNRYAKMSGTSMATPTSVGVAAEVLSNFPQLGPKQLKKVLMNAVTPIKKFKKKMAAGGRIDLYNSLQYTLENYINL
ncbi:MAG: S8 family serine peptidase [Halobacteriovoraceae bacterium]|jgi:thermitase|nr:S8 family serine peptidase [Halobacteriovoraceae bacterium]